MVSEGGALLSLAAHATRHQVSVKKGRSARDMAAGSMLKLKGGPGARVYWMNYPPRTVKCGENRPDIRLQRLVELSTVSNDCTPEQG